MFFRKSLLVFFCCFIYSGNHLFAQTDKTGIVIPEKITTFPLKSVSPKINFMIAPNFAATNFGFICKKELQLEKQIKIPLRLRVGSLENCHWMEGKLRYRPIGNY